MGAAAAVAETETSTLLQSSRLPVLRVARAHKLGKIGAEHQEIDVDEFLFCFYFWCSHSSSPAVDTAAVGQTLLGDSNFMPRLKSSSP